MELIQTLKKNKENIGLVLELDYRNLPFIVFDNSKNNEELKKINIADPEEFTRFTAKKLKEKNAKFSIGKYNENRIIYDHSRLFAGQHKRTVHLAIDLFFKSGTRVLTPLNGKVHSFKNNDEIGDYGPTIILQHNLDDINFHTLYGHLSLDSIEKLRVGQEFKKGDVIGRIGNYPINGNWPAHLHFQIIKDMEGNKGDYPGVCSLDKRKYYLENCPDPNLILQISNIN